MPKINERGIVPLTFLVVATAIIILIGLTSTIKFHKPFLDHLFPKSPSHAVGPTTSLTYLDTMVFGTGYKDYGTFGSHNQRTVSNRNGIFIVYTHSSYVAETDLGTWRLARSTDGGITFTTIYEHTSNYHAPPTIEIDENDNVYIFETYTAGVDVYTSPTAFYKFSASLNYQNPTITHPIPTSAGKFTSAYDPIRKVIYFVTWNYLRDVPNFFVLNLNGTLSRSSKLWITKPPSQIDAHYPHIYIAEDGKIFVAWTNVDWTVTGQDYYDAHFIASLDGGSTWVGKTGNISIPFDPGPSGPAWEIVDSVDIKPVGTLQDNWLDNMFYHQGKLHFVYGVDFGDKEVYKRFDWASKSFTNEISPSFHGENYSIASNHGFFSGNTSGRIYYTGRGGGTYFNKIITLYSDDNGSTWHDYSISNQFVTTTGVYAGFISGTHNLMSNGSIIGGITADGVGTTPSKVYFFQVSGVTNPIPTPTITPSSTPNPTPKPGDLNGDGHVDVIDYGIFAGDFQVFNSRSDFDHDGHITVVDYGIWVDYFRQANGIH